MAGVMAQRLVRTLCAHCKTSTEHVDEAKWRALTHPWNVPVPKRIGKAVGCLECRKTGYLGRVGIYEMFKLTPASRQAITKDTDLQVFSNVVVKDGMKPLRISAAQHVARGTTTMEEVLGALPPVDS